MEKWEEVARVIKELDRAVIRLSQPMLEAGIGKSSKIYNDYRELTGISNKLRSELEEEMLSRHPGVSDEKFRIMFYGDERIEE